MKRNCNNCQSAYQAESRYVNRGQGLYCSRKCSGEATSKRHAAARVPNSICAFCQKEFWRLPAKANKTKFVFCSKEHQSSAARQTSGIDYSSGPAPTKSSCLVCHRSLDGKRQICNRCYPEWRIREWLAGDLSITLTQGKNKDTKSFVKQYLLETRGDQCEECGFDQHGLFGSIIQMDHVDGNCYNNDPANLKLLCPNCHAMTPTYGSRNKGSGRAHRRKSAE